MRSSSRRQFILQSGFLALGFYGLKSLSRISPQAHAQGTDLSSSVPMRQIPGYGPALPDPQKIFDLPKGFSYQVLARKQEAMDDGWVVPGDADGMAAFGLADGRIALICNHELDVGESDEGPFGKGNRLWDAGTKLAVYDRGQEGKPHLGGTTTLIFNPQTRKKELHFLSLAGTCNNCAGGPTPWNSWITCEETNRVRDEVSDRDHGYNFEVPVTTHPQVADPIPLKAMGRFRHEAIAVDPRTGIVYQTEDMGDGLIYRFIPEQKGRLAAGGKLQALAILDQPSADTRNWDPAKPFPMEVPMNVKWIDIEDVESPDDSLRHQGFGKGAAKFARGEGMWYGNGEIYFACTNGGRIQKGQVFRYVPSRWEGSPREKERPGTIELAIESTNQEVLKNCDNLTVAPWGDLFICEDSEAPCKLTGVTPDGAFFEFGVNRHTSSELAGACFSPDGEWLFLNIQNEGLTLAITGPWKKSWDG